MFNHHVDLKPIQGVIVIFDPIDGTFLAPEIQDWLRDHSTARWDWKLTNVPYDHASLGVRFSFEVPHDAVEFKLRWY